VVLALPEMAGAVGVSTEELQRAAPIISGFLLGYVAMLPLIGRIADLRGRVPVLVAALNNLALARRGRGELELALGLTDTALELCAAQGDRHREAALHNNKADLLHALRQPEDAMSQIKAAVAIFAEVGAAEGMMQPEIWKLAEW